MLIFVGLGLYDEMDISIKGLETIKRSKKVFAEFYTSKMMGTTIDKLEKFYGKDIELLGREDIEIRSDKIIETARNKDVAFLCAGDPMIATTHIDLRIRAEDAGVKTRIIHGSSIQTAVIGLSGLQNYKFGRSTTIPRPYKNIIAESPYDVFKNNLDNNLHTLFLLDISDEPMTINEGLKILLNISDKRKDYKFKDNLCVGIARAGSDNPVVKADFIKDILDYNFGPPLHTFILPAKLHFMEKEALIRFAKAPKEILTKET